MKKFKKIYIEITNICNLNCEFCPKDDLKKEEMTPDNFEIILNKINDYTDYIYLHVKGEPLLHSKLEEIINLCNKYNKKVNITTNGTLLKTKYHLLNNVRQINISLQSLVNINLLDEIFDVVDVLSKSTYISYRLWTKTSLENKILDKIKNKYKNLDNKLDHNIYLSFDKEFIWPNLDNEFNNDKGTCYGTRDHIGILVDGTIIPCCLDSKGIINLGNIFEDNLDSIINSKRFINMNNGFKNNLLCEKLCKKCGFIKKFEEEK